MREEFYQEESYPSYMPTDKELKIFSEYHRVNNRIADIFTILFGLFICYMFLDDSLFYDKEAFLFIAIFFILEFIFILSRIKEHFDGYCENDFSYTTGIIVDGWKIERFDKYYYFINVKLSNNILIEKIDVRKNCDLINKKGCEVVIQHKDNVIEFVILKEDNEKHLQ